MDRSLTGAHRNSRPQHRCRNGAPLPLVRVYLAGLGIQVEVMSTHNTCLTYNLLAEEGRRVTVALVPETPAQWEKSTI
ncbi:hypothetical protein B0H14DRAFT_3444548 [Mycena olivaceomarginata]|nr:hypothetical protein B0H14DRAFT_3444548 [Mycena olivaceomarginata]